MSVPTLPRDLRRALAAVAEPERAAPMRAYMKSSMPYLGVSSVPLRRVCREVFASLDLFLFYIFWEAMLVPMYFLMRLGRRATDLCHDQVRALYDGGLAANAGGDTLDVPQNETVANPS